MVNIIKSFAVIIPVAIVAVLLALLIPSSILLEFFLILVGMFFITVGSLIIVKEVTRLIDLRHRSRIQREFRELELQRAKQRQVLDAVRYRRMNKGRN